MQRPVGNLFYLGTSLLVFGCYNSPVSIEENTLTHDKLNFSIALPDNLVAQGWTIRADQNPATYKKDYRVRFVSPDVHALPPLDVEIRRQSYREISQEEWIEHKSFVSLQQMAFDMLKDWQSLEENMAPISFSGIEGLDVEYLRIHRQQKIIDIGYSILLKNKEFDVEFNAFHSTNVRGEGNFETAIAEHSQRLQTAIAAYKSIAATLAFK